MPRQIRQSSFAGGEIAPELYSRSDVERHSAALRRARGCIISLEGAAINRPGFAYLGREVSNSANRGWLRSFIFGGTQNYILEFGNLTMRVIQNGAYVGAPFSLVTPWTSAQLPYLKFTQSGDTLIVDCGGMQPRIIQRVASDNWTIATWATSRTAVAPTGVSVTSNSSDVYHAAKSWAWVVTSVTGGDSPEESLPSSPYTQASGVVYPDRPVTVTWNSAANAVSYNIYRGQSGSTFYGYVGNVTGTSFRDDGQIPVYAEAPPTGKDPFAGGATRYPQVPAYFGQRLWHANSQASPQAIWASKIGALKNFDSAEPPKADDGIFINIASRTFDEIRSILPLNQLILFCAGSEWILMGQDGNPPSPTSLDARPRSYWGSAWLDPIVAGDQPLFLTDKDTHIREFAYLKSEDSAEGRDLTTMVPHLFRGHTIVDWAYARTPYSTVWCVRDDGILIAMGYSKQSGHIAFSWHDTDGIFENVAVCPEGTEDVVYVIVKRWVNGAWRRYVERMDSRAVTNSRYGKFLDANIWFDNTIVSGATVTVTAGNWAIGQTATLTASASTFSAGDVGKTIVVQPGKLTGDCKFLITGYTSATIVTGTIQSDVPTAIRGAAQTVWARALTAVTGLSHLEGAVVYALVDGKTQGPFTVASGAITLTTPGVFYTIGRAYISEVELNDLYDGGKLVSTSDFSMTNRIVTKVGVQLVNSAGVVAGEDSTRLTRAIVDATTDYETGLYTGLVEISIESAWNTRGRATIRQTEPLPMCLTGVVREVEIPTAGGGRNE